MSTTAAPVTPTALQPAIHPDNIVAHPGSTFAGIGLWASGLFTLLANGGMPATSSAWIAFGVQAAVGLLAMLGK